MSERSMPEVPDLNARYRAERAMRDLTWGPGRTMPEVPQMTHPSYRDMSLRNAGRERDHMRDRMFHDQQEAVAEIPAPSEDMKGKVIDEIEKGYYLNDKLIRFAKVVVGK